MKRLIPILFFCMILVLGYPINIVYAYSTKDITSLEKKLTTSSGNEKVDVLNQLSETYLSSSAEKAIEYGEEALKIAQEISYKKGISASLHSIAMGHYASNSYNEALAYAQNALSYSESIHDEHSLGISYITIGLINQAQQKNIVAEDLFQKALKIFEELDDKKRIGFCLNNLGTSYDAQGNAEKALDYYLQALKIYEDLNDKDEIATCLNNIGYVHGQLDNYERAREYYINALEYSTQIDNKESIGICLNNIGFTYLAENNFEEALAYFTKSLEINEEIGNKSEIGTSLSHIEDAYNQMGEIDDALAHHQKALKAYEESKDQEGIISSLNNIGTIYNLLGEYEKALEYHQKSLDLAHEISYIQGITSGLQNIAYDYAQIGEFEKAFEYLENYSSTKDMLLGQEFFKNIQEWQEKFETEKKEGQIALLERDGMIKQIIIILSAIILSVTSILGYGILKEKKKSDKLLLNILPVRVANDLKKTGKTIPESFEEVTIYFSDIVGFTNASSSLEPKFLIEELSTLFTAFDMIMERNHCERVKTIGDAYFGICGLPVHNANHAQNIVNASLEIIEYITKRNENSPVQWKIRVGIHSGKVVGGVVGVKKYIYDVFGDTVNTASRMESNSEPMRINVSDTTYNLVKAKFIFTQREPLEVKGKGSMNMYFLDGKSS